MMPWRRYSAVVIVLVVFLGSVNSARFPHRAFGRGFEIWSFSELIERSDLVVIAEAISVADADETTVDVVPKGHEDYLTGVITTFNVNGILKGKFEREKLEVAHCRVKDDAFFPRNGPMLVSFRTKDGIQIGSRWMAGRPQYLLFLKKRQDGIYGMIRPYDPELAVREILPPLDHDRISQLTEGDSSKRSSQNSALGVLETVRAKNDTNKWSQPLVEVIGVALVTMAGFFWWRMRSS